MNQDRVGKGLESCLLISNTIFKFIIRVQEGIEEKQVQEDNLDLKEM